MEQQMENAIKNAIGLSKKENDAIMIISGIIIAGSLVGTGYYVKTYINAVKKYLEERKNLL